MSPVLLLSYRGYVEYCLGSLLATEPGASWPELFTYSTAVILQAVANGYRYGFDVIDITGLPGGTVYPRCAASRTPATSRRPGRKKASRAPSRGRRVSTRVDALGPRGARRSGQTLPVAGTDPAEPGAHSEAVAGVKA